MKTNHASGGIKEGPSRPLGRGRRHKGWVLGALSAALVLSLWLGRGWLGSGSDAASNAKPPRAGKLTLKRYLLRGYWRADARTLVAAGRLLLDPETPLAPGLTNVAPPPLVPNTNLPAAQSPA